MRNSNSCNMKRVQTQSKGEISKNREILPSIQKTKISKPQTPDNNHQNRHKSNDRNTEKVFYSNQPYLKSSLELKQQNLSPVYSPSADEPVFNEQKEIPKQRSRSTVVSNRQPWSQLLNKHSHDDGESVFGKFDPLRTLHFLARELQTHIRTKLPEETGIQQIIHAMQTALKRIPPEVASTIQLQQQSLEMLPKFKSISKDSLNYDNAENKKFEEFQKIVETSTAKLESSCKNLENLCGELKDDKLILEKMLQNEQSNSKELQKKLDEMMQVHEKLVWELKSKNQELEKLRNSMNKLEAAKLENAASSVEIEELKESKLNLYRETQKLEHQLRLSAIEKEKYLAILAVRDRQIYEIRLEMTQLQQSVNTQLIDLHKFATSAIPNSVECFDIGKALSSIWLNENKSLIEDDSD